VEWSRAYAKQGLSDLRVRSAVAERFEPCHSLHYLQMAAEKICKAHQCLTLGYEAVNRKRTHEVVVKVLPALAKKLPRRASDKRSVAQSNRAAVKRFADAIETLAPAVHHGQTRQDNCEYPWLSKAQQVVVPCEYRFPVFDVEERFLVPVLEVLKKSAEDLLNG
jgi:hypothetical protein